MVWRILRPAVMVCWWPIQIAKRRAKHPRRGGYGVPSHCSICFLNKHVKEALIEHPTTRNDGMEHPSLMGTLPFFSLFPPFFLFSSFFFSLFKKQFFLADWWGMGPRGPQNPPLPPQPHHGSGWGAKIWRNSTSRWSEMTLLYCKIHHLNNGTSARVMHYRYSGMLRSKSGGTNPP